MTNYVKEYNGFKVPKGAQCFVKACEAYKAHFGKNVNGIEYVFVVDNENPEWYEISALLPLSTRGAIPLPQEPESKEWVGELPPVGCECEATWLELPDGGGSDFCEVVIKGYYGNEVWFSKVRGVDGYSEVLKITDCEFRPLKTEKEKEREAFIEKALNLIVYQKVGGTKLDLAEAFFNAGFKAPEGE